MSLILRNNTWHVDIMLDGQRIRQSTETTNRKLAQKIHAKIYSSIIEGKYYPKSTGENRLFCEMMEKFVKEHRQYRGKIISQNTKESYAHSLKHLLPVFAEIPLKKITSERIERYMNDRETEGASPGSINREFSLLSVAFNNAIKWKWRKFNPCKDIEKLPEDNQRIKYLSATEVTKLYAKLPEYLKPIVTVARFTGLRISNILELTWEKVDLFRKVIIIGKTKNGEPLGIPMNHTVSKTLNSLAKLLKNNTGLVFQNEANRKRSRHNVSSAFTRACRRAGIEDFRFHDLRHDFGSNLVQRGISIYSVKELMGHKDVRTTQRYAHLSPDKLKVDIAALDKPMTQISHKPLQPKSGTLQPIEKKVGARGFEPPTT
ncbi:MAG TPA: site-specific integrase [Nitrospinota bacterium]|nr:site-specific integrase [Nitrospinota bacterium]